MRYHPVWEPRYVVRDGKRVGPFLFSTAWTKTEDIAATIFGKDGNKKWQDRLKKQAFNKQYTPPANPVHLASAVISYQEKEIAKWRDQAIAAKKEISALKRNKAMDLAGSGDSLQN